MSYINFKYHIIFSTKQRRPWLDANIHTRLAHYMGGIIRDLSGTLLACNGAEDHLHLVTTLSQKLAVMEVLKQVKGGSSLWIHTTFPQLRDFDWQDGYAAFTISHSATEDVVQYVLGQSEHHKKMSFQEELILFLQRHEVQYDERYIWR